MIRAQTRAGSGFTAVRFGALGLAAVLVLSGCSGSGGEPGAEAAEGTSSSAAPSDGAGGDASESPTPTPSSTPTPAAAVYKPASAEGPAENVPLPVMPELAKQESKEGLEAFARHWYALVNYGFETGDVEPLKQISGAECVVCLNVYDLLDHGYAKKQDWILGGKLEVLGTQSNYVLTSKGFYQVLIQIKQDPYEYRAVGDHVYEVNEGLESTTVQMIEATYSGGQWFANNAVTIR